MTFTSANNYMVRNYLKLAKEDAWMETRWSWSKCDEEDLELWAHIDAVQSTHIERGLFCTWLSTVSEYEKEIKAGRQWMLGVQEALEPGGDEWIPGPEFEQKWENDEVCFNHYTSGVTWFQTSYDHPQASSVYSTCKECLVGLDCASLPAVSHV